MIPALLIRISSPWPPSTFSTSARAFLMLAGFVTSRGTKTTRPFDFSIKSVRARGCFRAVANIVLTSEDFAS